MSQTMLSQPGRNVYPLWRGLRGMSTANATIVLILGLIGSPLLAQSNANTEWRIPGYSSYVELKDGTVSCGGQYDSYHESRTGKVCAGGQYDSYHESRTGATALRFLGPLASND